MCVRATFQAKQTALTFSAKICPKMDLGLEIQKTNVGIRISIVKMACMPISRKNGQLTFLAQICPKRKLGFEVQKTSDVGIRISIFELPCVPIFRQNGQF